jgi:hypothetical protein
MKKIFLFILVQINHALCINNMFKQKKKIKCMIIPTKFIVNIHKLNKDINMVYQSLVYKNIYHATTQRNSNKLYE